MDQISQMVGMKIDRILTAVELKFLKRAKLQETMANILEQNQKCYYPVHG